MRLTNCLNSYERTQNTHTPLTYKNETRIIHQIGVIAQLVERYNGIVEVRGSIPLGSTISGCDIGHLAQR